MERRLRHLGRALGAAGAAEPAPTKLFRQHDDGTIVHEDLLDLLEQEQAAAQAKDYRAAQLLRDTWEVLRPKPRLTLEECAPTDVEEQVAFFLQHGFCILHGVIPAEALPRAQAAWTAAQEQAEAAWEANTLGENQNKADRSFFDISNVLALDDVFIDMIDSPAVVPLLSRVTGNPRALSPDSTIAAAASDGCMWVGGMGGRIVPSEGNADGYTKWHRRAVTPRTPCHPHAPALAALTVVRCSPFRRRSVRCRDKPSSYPSESHGFTNPSYRHVKVFTGLWDIPVNG